MPAVPPYIIEPIWQQFSALLPERKTSHPLGCHRPRIPDRVIFEKRLTAFGSHPGGRSGAGDGAGGRDRSPGPRLRFGAHSAAPAGVRSPRADLPQGQTHAPERDQALGHRAHQLLAERSQEAPLVYGAARAGCGLLDGPLGGDLHSEEAREGGMDSLPMGRSSFSTAMTYPRGL